MLCACIHSISSLHQSTRMLIFFLNSKFNHLISNYIRYSFNGKLPSPTVRGASNATTIPQVSKSLAHSDHMCPQPCGGPRGSDKQANVHCNSGKITNKYINYITAALYMSHIPHLLFIYISKYMRYTLYNVHITLKLL